MVRVVKPVIISIEHAKHSQRRFAACTLVIGDVTGFALRNVKPRRQRAERYSQVFRCYGGGGNAGNYSIGDNAKAIDRAPVIHESISLDRSERSDAGLGSGRRAAAAIDITFGTSVAGDLANVSVNDHLRFVVRLFGFLFRYLFSGFRFTFHALSPFLAGSL